MNTTQYRRRFLPVPGTDIAAWEWIGDAHEVLDVHVGFWGTIAECGQVSVRAERVLEKHTVAVADPETTFTFEMTPFRSDTPCTSVVPPNAFDVAWSFTDGRHIHKRRTRYAVARRSWGAVFLDVDDFLSNGTPFRMLEFVFWDQRDWHDFQPPASLVGTEVTDEEEYADVAIANRRSLRWTWEPRSDARRHVGGPAAGDDAGGAQPGPGQCDDQRTLPTRNDPREADEPAGPTNEREPEPSGAQEQIDRMRGQMESEQRAGRIGGESSYFDQLWRREERRARDRRFHYGGPRDGAPIDAPDEGTGTDIDQRRPAASDEGDDTPGT